MMMSARVAPHLYLAGVRCSYCETDSQKIKRLRRQCDEALAALAAETHRSETAERERDAAHDALARTPVESETEARIVVWLNRAGGMHFARAIDRGDHRKGGSDGE